MRQKDIDWIGASIVKAQDSGLVNYTVLAAIDELLREELSERQLSVAALRNIAIILISKMVPETEAKE